MKMEQSVPKRRTLCFLFIGGYLSAYEDGTVFRNVGI